EHQAAANFRLMRLEIALGTSSEIAHLDTDALTGSRLGTEQRDAGELRAVLERELCRGGAPASVGNRLHRECRRDRGEALARERKRARFAGGTGAPAAAIAQADEIGPQRVIAREPVEDAIQQNARF